MKVARIFLWLVLFTFSSFLFVFFAFMTLQGPVRHFSFINIIISSIYMLIWILLSIYAGYKKFDDVLTAAIIYSLYPFLGYTEIYVVKIAGIGYILSDVWSYPIQGFLTSNSSIQERMYLIISFLQPLIFLLGYLITSFANKKYNFSASNNDHLTDI